MSEELQSRPRGNPAWVKGGASPNPRGRPRTGLALAERIRARVDPDELIDFMFQVVRGKVTNGDGSVTFTTVEQRGAAWKFLAEHGFMKPPTQIEAGKLATAPDLSDYTPEQLVSMEAVLQAAANGAELSDVPGRGVLRELEAAAIVDAPPLDVKRIGGD